MSGTCRGCVHGFILRPRPRPRRIGRQEAAKGRNGAPAWEPEVVRALSRFTTPRGGPISIVSRMV